ncbi:pseudaminic acid synthase [Legionella impletisoli]|uniref:Sialic acid synthase n=1 Tax=Legionella impletisoli TaxID=343510 RepID=A0A917JQN9_9GAMM|nr:pseudaminic acid synthase [Legionella impletisoli]GGI82083.1 sialic acid synthase [Legionella impletisoli]
MSFSIGNFPIGTKNPPFIIAEMSGNHNQSLERALEIVDAIADSGAHAIKLQTYKPETMTLDLNEGEFFISDAYSPWKGNSLYNLYRVAHTPWEWHEAIFERAKKRNLIAFSTPFDLTAVDFLESLDVPAYKIASFENTDLGLIQRVASTGKPIIISTGMATLAEIDESVRAAREAGCRELILLKCTSSYPANPAHSNLATIPYLRTLFNCEVGLSDHTLGIGAAIASVAMGATVIEKHFTLSRDEGGVDAAFSLEPAEFKLLVSEARTAYQAIGQIRIGEITEEEEKSKIFRRTLYVCEDVVEGEVLNKNNLRAIRPGYGLPAKYLKNLLGKRVTKDLKRGTPMSWDFI